MDAEEVEELCVEDVGVDLVYFEDITGCAAGGWCGGGLCVCPYVGGIVMRIVVALFVGVVALEGYGGA